MSEREYEFDEGENEILRSFSRHAAVWGVLSLVAATVCVAVAVAGAHVVPIFLAAAVVEASIGGAFVFAAREVRLAVVTAGHDVEHTMRALGAVSRALTIQIVVAGASLLFVAVDSIRALWSAP